jgi:hypothetical protein
MSRGGGGMRGLPEREESPRGRSGLAAAGGVVAGKVNVRGVLGLLDKFSKCLLSNYDPWGTPGGGRS